MSLNCAEIDLVLEELNLEGSFIQEIVQPSFDTIAFNLYKGARGASDSRSGSAETDCTGTGADDASAGVAAVAKTLLVCLAPGVCRLHETRRRVPKSEKPLRFMEFLRSRIRGARITGAVQLNSDRIILLTLTHGDETFFMYIRLWSGAANIILTTPSHEILDVFYRRPKRGEVTGGSFELPEPKSPPAGAAAFPGESAKVFTVRELPGDESFNLRIDRWYGEHAATLSREALVVEARRRHDTKIARLEAALAKLEKKRTEFLNADSWRHQGDLLTANLWAIKPGEKFVEVTDYENGNATIRIPLDPMKKPQENAAALYEKYRKAESGLADLEDDIASTRRTVDTLNAELAAIEAEQNPLVIQKTLRRQNKPRQQIEKRYPGLTFRKDGWIMLVGRTAAENDELLRRHVKGSDLWLHTRDWPGGYVFVKNRAGKSVPLDILLDAGTLALFYSKGRKAGTADLYYTHVKYLRRAKNAPKGTVLPTNEKNLTVKLDDARLKALETCKDEE
jgi:predicted ribosome quality control (RQC) complex YloA/Tae2 family protein